MRDFVNFIFVGLFFVVARMDLGWVWVVIYCISKSELKLLEEFLLESI